jgi:hypothetical protein
VTPVIGQVLEVIPAEPEPGELLGSNVDAPRAGSTLGAYAIDVSGWALGRRLPVVEVELLDGEARVCSVPADLSRPDVAAAFPDVDHARFSGFHALTSSLQLDPDFELIMEAVLQDGSRAKIATIRGRRDPLRSSFEPRFQPLMVTAPGRTGSTLLMRMLAGHPRILTYRPFQFEPRVASYWIGLLKALSDPASYLRQLSDARNLDQPSWWLGANLPLPRALPDDSIQEWMGGAGVRELAAFCQDRIEALYRQIALDRGRDDAAYFTEKYIPGSVQPLLWELYPQAREVILVRDFRDMLSSMFAFNEKRGIQGFQRSRAESDEEYVVHTVGSSITALLRDWRARSDRAHLVRYEELVTRPVETLSALLVYLGWDPEAATVEAMTAGASETTPEMEWHQTADSAAGSIGRWQRDLSPELRAVSEAAFGPALSAFGYTATGTDQREGARAEPDSRASKAAAEWGPGE